MRRQQKNDRRQRRIFVSEDSADVLAKMNQDGGEKDTERQDAKCHPDDPDEA
jgi:hypothetical protein